MELTGEYIYAQFVERPNRFLAIVRLSNGDYAKAHVPDPGRLKELFLPKTQVFLRKENNYSRKTKYSVIGILSVNGEWVNIDSQISNKLFERELNNIDIFKDYAIVKKEFTYGKSRLDFLIEDTKRKKKALVEVKSVTLVEDNLALFPDAPTKRGTRHLEELEKAVSKDQYESFVVFIVKRSDAKRFSPNWEMDEIFSKTLVKCAKKGVKVIAVKCLFSPKMKTISFLEKLKVTF